MKGKQKKKKKVLNEKKKKRNKVKNGKKKKRKKVKDTKRKRNKERKEGRKEGRKKKEEMSEGRKEENAHWKTETLKRMPCQNYSVNYKQNRPYENSTLKLREEAKIEFCVDVIKKMLQQIFLKQYNRRSWFDGYKTPSDGLLFYILADRLVDERKDEQMDEQSE